MILNSIQSREYNRAQQLQHFFYDNTGVYSLFAPFNNEVSLFFDNNKQLNVYIPLKTDSGGGITESKKALRASVTKQINNVSTLTLSYAITTGNKDLEVAVNYRTSKVSAMKDSEVLGLANGLVTVITPLLKEDAFQAYTIIEDTLQTLTDTAVSFNNTIGKAAIIDGNNSIAHKKINEIIKAISGNIAQFNLLINYFKQDNPDFVEWYHKNSVINDSGIRHNGVEGVVTSLITGVPSLDAVIRGRGKNKIVKSDLKGAYRLMQIRPGESNLIVSAPDVPEKTFVVKIIRGKIIVFNIAI